MMNSDDDGCEQLWWCLSNYDIVCRIRIDLGLVTNVRPEDLAAVYLQGWSASTLRVYTAAFKDIARYGGVFGKHWYRWNSGDVTSYLINGSALTPNSIIKLGAVMSLLFGCCDRPSPGRGPTGEQSKSGCFKMWQLQGRLPGLSGLQRICWFLSPPCQLQIKLSWIGG